MSHEVESNGRWAKGTSGNPAGRPRGSRNRATVLAESLLQGEVEALTRKLIEMALEGNIAAMRLCLERLVPPRRERHVDLDIPDSEGKSTPAVTPTAILQGVADGQITPAEGESMANILAIQSKLVDTSALEARIAALEKIRDERRGPYGQ